MILIDRGLSRSAVSYTHLDVYKRQTQCLMDFFKKIHKQPHILVMAIFAFLMGYVFGFIVSLDKFVVGGPSLFIVYYISGLLFDTFHAVGNFFFYLIGAPLLMKIFVKNKSIVI